MSSPTLPERFTLRTLWLLGRVGLGGAVTRFYLWMLARLGPVGMPMVFRGYEPTSADVFVCTVSKSGTNWMMQVVVQIADRGRADFDEIHEVVPWPEAPVASQVAPLSTPVRSVTGLRAIKKDVIQHDASHHRLAHGHRADANARIMAALGHDLGFFARLGDRLSGAQDR